ncbi:MAG: hypothetical protein V4609_06510 [Pseudomonadota bacterium]
MKSIFSMIILSLAAACASAQPTTQDHSAHHPPGTAPVQGVAPPAAPGDALSEQMKKMQDMRQRMQAAATPAERRALLDEQMKLMQSGMDMMGHMSAGHATGASMGSGMAEMMGMHQQMERRMAMMEQMMRMMVDREAAVPRR